MIQVKNSCLNCSDNQTHQNARKSKYNH